MKTSRYYWGTLHKGKSKLSKLQEENICLEKCVESLRKDNVACQEKISGLERKLDNQTRVIERISAERDNAQSRLAATMAELIKTEQLNRKQENWKEKYLELKAKADEQERKYKELRKKLNIRDGNEGPFGIAGSPSSNRPFQADSTEENRKKKGGAKYGHKGYGRRKFADDGNAVEENCSQVRSCDICCDHPELVKTGERKREYDRFIPARQEHVIVRQDVYRCQNCGKTIYAHPQDVLPRMSYSNSFLVAAAMEVYVNGRTARMTAALLGISTGTFFGLESFLASLLKSAFRAISLDLVRQKCLYVDETVWWNDGKRFYIWSFTNPNISLVNFSDSRSSRVPAQYFGYRNEQYVLPEGTDCSLIEEYNRYEGLTLCETDRFKGYNPLKINRQLCFEHLKRDLDNLLDKSDDEIPEVKLFHQQFRPLLCECMTLCADLTISDDEYYSKALALKDKIHQLVFSEANDCGIQNYQNIWRNEWQSLFHWTQNRNIRCENNTAERAVRPLVIVRKISFGSQGDQGVRNREIITTVLNTVRQRGVSPQLWLMDSLNELAQNPNYDIAKNLPPSNPVYERKLKTIESG